ncbi:MAG TPA: cupin domain-containing protein [Synergistaceae bacterium]|nr:cupin domain-containing protein [Synergistaceae bacterium]
MSFVEHHAVPVRALYGNQEMEQRILAWGGSLMLSEVNFASGVVLDSHKHPHEQITYVCEGKIRFTLGEEEKILCQGDSVYIPPEVPHAVEVLEDFRGIDVFSPVRKDFLE